MLLDLSKAQDKARAIIYLEELIEKKQKIELKQVRERRSTRQNAYLHAIITFFAIEYGETRDYVKQEIFKKVVNQQIFKAQYVNKKTGEVRDDWRSTSSLETNEMALAIERFRNWSSMNGIYIMTSEEFLDNHFYFKQLEEQHKEYL